MNEWREAYPSQCDEMQPDKVSTVQFQLHQNQTKEYRQNEPMSQYVNEPKLSEKSAEMRHVDISHLTRKKEKRKTENTKLRKIRLKKIKKKKRKKQKNHKKKETKIDLGVVIQTECDKVRKLNELTMGYVSCHA